MKLPTIETYGPYQGNYGMHALVVEMGALTVWFSYKTPVAFQVDGRRRVVHENIWGPTTGKHLNAIEPDKKQRVSKEEFNRLWEEQVAPLEGFEAEVRKQLTGI